MPNQAMTAAYSPRTVGPTVRAMMTPPSAAVAAAATLNVAVRAIAAPIRRLRRIARATCSCLGGAWTLNGPWQ